MKRLAHNFLKIILTTVAVASFFLMVGECKGNQLLWSGSFAALLAITARVMDRIGMFNEDKA